MKAENSQVKISSSIIDTDQDIITTIEKTKNDHAKYLTRRRSEITLKDKR